jgi:glycosyltransferase involved in cell wall biosynthesis
MLYQISSPDAEFRIRAGKKAGPKGAYQVLRGRMDLRVRRRLSRQVDVVLAISEGMRTYLARAEGLDPDRVFSFPMGFKTTGPTTADSLAGLRKQLGLIEGRTIVYSGVIDPVRDPFFMLDVLEAVRQTFPDVVLLVVTHITDNRRTNLEHEAASRRLPVKFVGPLPHSEVSLYLRLSDVMISPYPPMLEHRVCSPTKSLEALGVGLPVVGSAEVEDHVKVFRESGGGMAAATNVAAFAEAVNGLLSDPGRRQTMGEQGRRWVLKHRTYNHLTRYLESIVESASSHDKLKRLPHSSDDAAEIESGCSEQLEVC